MLGLRVMGKKGLDAYCLSMEEIKKRLKEIKNRMIFEEMI